jgi:hypothetical protein
MASTKRSSSGTRKSAATRSRSASASKAASGTSSAKTRSNGRATNARTTKPKPTAARARTGTKSAPKGRTTKQTTASRNGSQANGTAGTLKQKGAAVLHAADKVGGPGLTLAAAAAGLAGGLALRQRPRMTDPGIAAKSRNVLRDVDPTAVMEGIGKAAARLGQGSKVVARELDQVADRAERLGKILS